MGGGSRRQSQTITPIKDPAKCFAGGLSSSDGDALSIFVNELSFTGDDVDLVQVVPSLVAIIQLHVDHIRAAARQKADLRSNLCGVRQITGIDMLERATRLRPENIVYWETLINVRDEAHEFSLAREDTERAIERNPASEDLQEDLALICLWSGEILRATQVAEHTHMDSRSREYWNMERALVQNQPAEAKGSAQRLLARNHLDDADRAVLYAVLGNEAEALSCLNREEDHRSLKAVLFARLDDHFSSIRSHPAFQQLLRRMRLVS
jgi:predicted Zn-dependent protease